MNRNFLILLSLFLILGFGIKSFAQQNDSSIGSYEIFILNPEIGKKLFFFTQVRFHNYEVLGNQKQFLVRSAFEYQFTKHFKFHLGFSTVDKKPLDKSLIENFQLQRWIYDEYQFNFGTPSVLKVKTRFRHERRWIYPNNSTETLRDNRLRFQLMLIKNISKKVYVKAFSEAFYVVQQDKLVNMRNNLSFGRPLSKDLKFEIGLIHEGLKGKTSQFIVSRLYINNSWRKKKPFNDKSSVPNPSPIETVIEESKQLILFDTNEKVDTLIGDDPLFDQGATTNQDPQKAQEVVKTHEETIDDKVPLETVVVNSNELRHYVITAAHKDKKSTSKSLDRLKRDGYDGQVLEISKNGYYRVSAKSFKDKSKAELTRQNLASIGYHKPWILSTPDTISTVELISIKRKTNHLNTSDSKSKQSKAKEGITVIDKDSSYERTSNSIPYRPIHHVIAASTTDLNQATTITENLRKMGFVNAYILNSNNAYRVSAAHFKNRSDTKAAIDVLKNQGFKGAWVLIEEE